MSNERPKQISSQISNQILEQKTEQRKIIHVDMDAFYASVEMRDFPEYRDIPIAVGGDGPRSVLCTCNYLAREFGVRSAMPAARAKLLCPELKIVNGRMTVYQEVSAKIREIFSRYTSIIEPLSLDEAYLDVTACPLFNGSATLIAEDIRLAIANELQLTASAGIAPIKFLAKIASDLNKPNGQYVITPQQVSGFIDTMPLSKIPGVGKVMCKKLLESGLEFGRDIKALDEASLIRQFGKLGRSLWYKCNGDDDRAIVTKRIRKSVGVERTFADDINNLEELSDYMNNNLIPELKSRAKKYLSTREISKLGIKVKFKDFHQTTKEFKFHQFDDSIFQTLLQEGLARGEGKAVRLLGVHIGLGERPQSHQQFEFTLD
ncbi:DNA polymerase IV [Colwellia echini]|uniref:DNA polymerase IV n=1 Tax=Colwellia echini TaxID=1982103 RepID=A0ABY3MXX9_9GAMM|nr:DNA polymerase IV [Colwellia echini]TYK65892.1 DNA polymerase IV [Colwellia echini]